MAKKYQLMADFETTTSPDDVRVWAGCFVDIDTFKTVLVTNNIADMFEYLQNKDSEVYYHNLKFDGEFIISYLLNNGYRLSKERAPMCFDTLITDTGVFYSIRVTFAVRNKGYNQVTFYDSLKKLPFKVAQISKAFSLEDEKLEIDYNEYRAPGHELTEQERAYIEADCKIVAQALHIQRDKGLKNMTNASDAMSDFKARIGKERFEKLFPIFPYETDKDIRRAYKGGYVYVNPKFQGVRGLQGQTYDVNSLYPSVMYYELLPYGYPAYFEGEPEYDENFPLYIVKLRTDFELKPGHLPIIQIKKQRWARETEYLTNSKDAFGEYTYPEMIVTSVDLELIKEHYELIDPEYIFGYKFKGKTGIFNPYIDYWMEIKANSTGAMRTLAKLMLNSLYGRFALNPDRINKIPYLDEKGVVRYVATGHSKPDYEPPKWVKEMVEQYKGSYGVEIDKPVYTAMACFITAYARKKTITTCQSMYDRFIYADTDSCHIVGDEVPDIEIHPSNLGAWKHEGNFIDSKFIRAKTYMETMHGYNSDTSLKGYVKLMQKSDFVRLDPQGVYWQQTKVTCAGMPDNVKELVTYDNFEEGATFEGKLAPRRYPGGIVLVPGPFTIH